MERFKEVVETPSTLLRPAWMVSLWLVELATRHASREASGVPVASRWSAATDPQKKPAKWRALIFEDLERAGCSLH